MGEEREKSYKTGIIDGLAMWGRVCGSKSSCESCPIGAVRGSNVTCQDFAKQFPEKMASILQELDNGTITFYEEYCTRFPECNIPIEEIAQMMCRKVVFEGYIYCDKKDTADCVKCWNEQYTGDITVTDADEYNGANYHKDEYGKESSGDDTERPAFLG